MNFHRDLAAHAKEELENALRKFKCSVHGKHPKIVSSNIGGAKVDFCCPEFEAIVTPHL